MPTSEEIKEKLSKRLSDYLDFAKAEFKFDEKDEKEEDLVTEEKKKNERDFKKIAVSLISDTSIDTAKLLKMKLVDFNKEIYKLVRKKKIDILKFMLALKNYYPDNGPVFESEMLEYLKQIEKSE